MYTRLNNQCAICGRKLAPFSQHTFTAHEFYCYQRNPDKIPERDREEYASQVLGLRRSEAAKRGVETRRRNKGKRAPR